MDAGGRYMKMHSFPSGLCNLPIGVCLPTNASLTRASPPAPSLARPSRLPPQTPMRASQAGRVTNFDEESDHPQRKPQRLSLGLSK